jgi:glycosyltransferase involved in cell wall biosynthesis
VRILHLVTLVSRDGAYGGPVRVAINQTAELRRRGHDVHIAAGWRGEGPVPRTLDGTPAFLFRALPLVPRMRHSGLVSLGLIAWLARNIDRYDVIHIHAGRDLISTASMTLASLKRTNYVTQTHGMVTSDHRLVARLMDALFTRRLLSGARRRFVLTQREQEDLADVLAPSLSFERVANGVPEAVIGTGYVEGHRVLFCARLHERKRPVAFVELAGELTRRGVVAEFAMVGPDEGQLARVRSAIDEYHLEGIVSYEGSLDYGEVLARMREASVYVLPSVDEPFAMTLLEALSLGLPCVCTDSCGVADILSQTESAIVTDGSVVAMADAVQRIFDDDRLRSNLMTNARRVIRDVFGMRAVGAQLERAYLQLAQDRP